MDNYARSEAFSLWLERHMRDRLAEIRRRETRNHSIKQQIIDRYEDALATWVDGRNCRWERPGCEVVMHPEYNTGGNKMQPFISTKNMSREDWLAACRNGIGGSDASAIMGQNPWASPLTVYLDKVGVAEKAETEAMRQGTDCEEVVARRFERETGMRVKRCNKMFQHANYPWMLANIDRQIICKGFVGRECKTTSPYNKADFEAGEVPANYFWQCQHYMAVTGAKEWYLAVMVFSTAFHVFRVVRNEMAIAKLIEAERSFWHDHVLAGIAPYPMGLDAENAAINGMHTARSDATIDLSDLRESFETLALLEAEESGLNKRIEAIRQAIKLRMGVYTSGRCARWNVSYADVQTTRIDSKRLKAEAPDTWKQYSKTTSSRTLKIKEA